MKKVIIIAEAGVNHNGSLENAKKLVDVAAQAGADYVKFQTCLNLENLLTKDAPKAEYQMRNCGDQLPNAVGDNQQYKETQFEMLKKLMLTEKDHLELIDYCRVKQIRFLSTGFDLESISFLKTLKLGVWKIPSGEITNFPMLRQIASYREKIILSTGMSTMDDVEQALHVLYKYGARKEDITLLHCTTEYPTPMEEVNLLAIKTLRKRFKIEVGYSDHTAGVEIAVAAVALGATIIEKHFTLSRNMEGPDHKASLEPYELKAMVTMIRKVELAIGTEMKYVTPSERKNMRVARKSIVAKTDIKKGTIFTEKNITVKRPGGGVSPMRWEEILGREASRDFKNDELIELSKLKGDLFNRNILPSGHSQE